MKNAQTFEYFVKINLRFLEKLPIRFHLLLRSANSIICFDWHRTVSYGLMHIKANVCLYMQPQRQDWKAAVSSPPTQRPSHQVGGRQSTLIGQLRPPVHWKQREHGFPSQKKMISISSSPHTNVPLLQ